MAEVLEHARAGRFTNAMVAIYREFGHDLRDPDCEPFRVMDCAVPKEQWEAICNALMEAPRDPLGKANLALSYVNYGPSQWV